MWFLRIFDYFLAGLWTFGCGIWMCCLLSLFKLFFSSKWLDKKPKELPSSPRQTRHPPATRPQKRKERSSPKPSATGWTNTASSRRRSSPERPKLRDLTPTRRSGTVGREWASEWRLPLLPSWRRNCFPSRNGSARSRRPFPSKWEASAPPTTQSRTPWNPPDLSLRMKSPFSCRPSNLALPSVRPSTTATASCWRGLRTSTIDSDANAPNYRQKMKIKYSSQFYILYVGLFLSPGVWKRSPRIQFFAMYWGGCLREGVSAGKKRKRWAVCRQKGMRFYS